ncbi:MAG: hypothetical protein WCF22_24905 [Candidatus Sulfotelmatobacter sp.]
MFESKSSNVRYAVIEARWIARPAERFVIEYRSEESLRDLIARPSIIGSGLVSREEALALSNDFFKVAPEAIRRTGTVCESKEDKGGSYSAHPGQAELGKRLFLKEIGKIPLQLFHRLAAGFVLIVFSKSIFSMALRSFMAI